jgi:uncharacterized membrane-anchored protein
MNFHLLCIIFSRRQIRWGMSLSTLLILVSLTAQSVLGQGAVGNRPGSKEFVSPWEMGMNTANLGSVASIGIPQGYRLMNEADARLFLEQLGNPVPKGLVGILAPQSGHWWAVFAFTGTGYLKDADKQPLDPVEILQALRKRAEPDNLSPVERVKAPAASVEWKELPYFNSYSHTLAWAIQADTQRSRTINDTVLILGRSGVLELTAVQPYEPGVDLPPITQLARHITFKEGKRYEDFQAGDKVANISLLGLIVDDEHPEFWNTRSGSRYVAWVFYSLIACLAACGLVIYTKRRRPAARTAIRTAVREATTKAASAHAAASTSNAAQGALAKSMASVHSPGNGSAVAAPGAHKIGSNGNGSKRAKPDKRGRRLVFNYAKFYTDFVMNTEPAIKSATPFKANGNGNGSNGHGPTVSAPNGHIGADQASLPQVGHPAATLVELISDQKALIDGQKHLILEQTRFIEEKRKFFNDQNQLLERQTAMFENQYSLKLD